MPTKNKELKAKYQAAWYQKHATEQKARVLARNARVLAENQQKVYDYLEAHSCVDCGESNPIVLDFDHNNPADKKDAVAHLVNGYPWETVAKEIAKCSVRCGNCHRIKTSRDGNYIRWRIWCGRRGSNSRPVA